MPKQVYAGPPHVELVQVAAAAGGEKGDEAVAGQADFFTGIEIEVVGVDLHPARRPARTPIPTSVSAAIRWL